MCNVIKTNKQRNKQTNKQTNKILLNNSFEDNRKLTSKIFNGKKKKGKKKWKAVVQVKGHMHVQSDPGHVPSAEVLFKH